MGIFNYFCRKENKIEKEETKMSKNVIVAEGYADDLYEISHNGEMKQTRFDSSCADVFSSDPFASADLSRVICPFDSKSVITRTP